MATTVKGNEAVPPLSFRRFVLCVLVATAASNVACAWAMLQRWQPCTWVGDLHPFLVGAVAGPVIWAFSDRRKLRPILAATFLGCAFGGIYLFEVWDRATDVLSYIYPDSDPATWSRCLVADYLFVQPLGGLVTCGMIVMCYGSFQRSLRKETVAAGCLFGIVLFVAAKANLHLCYVHLTGLQLRTGSAAGVGPWPKSVMFGLRVWGLGGYTLALVVLAALPVWSERPGSFVDRVAERAFGGRGKRLALLAILIVTLTIGAAATYVSVVNYAFLRAARAGGMRRAKLCLALGADLNAKDELGGGAMSRAVWSSRLEMIEFLLAKGLDVNAPCSSPYRDTPLHEAQRQDVRVETVLLLIRKGADVNARDEHGRTPLHDAVTPTHYIVEGGGSTILHGESNKVRVLLDNGADVNAVDNSGHTPLDIALKAGSTDLATLLRKHGGKTGQELKQDRN